MAISEERTLAGKTAIVTGASAGIGLHIARAFANEGVRLVLAARHKDRLSAVATELREAGAEVIAVAADISILEDAERLVHAAMASWGRVDILVNNAGDGHYKPFHQTDLAELLRMVDVNLGGTITMTHLVLPGMLRQGGGHIVNMASTAGKFGPAYASVYGATKAAMIAFTQSLRAEYHGTGVRASAICPGFTREGGIYERMKQMAGRGTPSSIGGTDAPRVAAATVRAIRRNQAEVIVNWPPVRPMLVFATAFPAWGEVLIRQATRRFFRRAAEAAIANEVPRKAA